MVNVVVVLAVVLEASKRRPPFQICTVERRVCACVCRWRNVCASGAPAPNKYMLGWFWTASSPYHNGDKSSAVLQHHHHTLVLHPRTSPGPRTHPPRVRNPDLGAVVPLHFLSHHGRRHHHLLPELAVLVPTVLRVGGWMPFVLQRKLGFMFGAVVVVNCGRVLA